MDDPKVQPSNESLWLRGFEVYLNSSDGTQSKIEDFQLNGSEGRVMISTDVGQISYNLHEWMIPTMEPGNYNITILITWSNDTANALLIHQIFYSTLVVDSPQVSTFPFESALIVLGTMLALIVLFIWIHRRK
jgi:hypothetical protein